MAVAVFVLFLPPSLENLRCREQLGNVRRQGVIIVTVVLFGHAVGERVNDLLHLAVAKALLECCSACLDDGRDVERVGVRFL